MASDTDDGGHPEVVRREEYPTWPADKPFPLTPLEAWYVMQGWAVKPAVAIDIDEFLELPGKLEFSDGHVMLWQS